MRSTAKWTVQAELDLEEILYYVAFHQGRLATAERIGVQIRDKCYLLATQPHMDEPRADRGRLSAVSHQASESYCRPTDDGIEFMRSVDGARDYSRLFG